MDDGLVEGATDEPCVCADIGEEAEAAECMSSISVRGAVIPTSLLMSEPLGLDSSSRKVVAVASSCAEGDSFGASEVSAPDPTASLALALAGWSGESVSTASAKLSEPAFACRSSSSRAFRVSICFLLSSRALINRCFSGVTLGDLCCKLL